MAYFLEKKGIKCRKRRWDGKKSKNGDHAQWTKKLNRIKPKTRIKIITVILIRPW